MQSTYISAPHQFPQMISFRTKHKELFLDSQFCSNIKVRWGNGVVEQRKPDAFIYVTVVEEISTYEEE